MRKLRTLLRLLGNYAGLLNEGRTEIESRRAVRDADVDRSWPAELKRRVAKA